jgi:hypothetical protein
LIKNPGFEEPSKPGEMPSDWSMFASTKNNTMALSTEEVCSGVQSLKISAQDANDAQVGVLQELAVKPGEKYVFRAQLKSARKDRIKGSFWGVLDIEWYNDKGKEIYRVSSKPWDRRLSKLHWKDYEIDAPAPDGAVKAKFVIRAMDGVQKGRGSFFVDDVEVVRED